MRFGFLAACALVAGAGGCALDESGILPNEGGVPDALTIDAPADTPADSPPPDASDGGPTDVVTEPPPNPCLSGPHHFCEGAKVCYPGTSCDNCGDGGVTPPLFCSVDDVCHFDCTGCGSQTAECYRCPGGVAYGTCESPSGGCIANPLPACGCSGGLSTCPGLTQVCIHSGPDHWCITCGAVGTDKETCVDGLQCNQLLGTCL